MSFLSRIATYWQANLDTLPVWIGVAPESQTFPYAILTSISSVPTWTTGNPYFEIFSFEVSIYATTLASAEALAQTVMDSLDFGAITNMACYRKNYFAMQDAVTPKRVFHVAICYDLYASTTLPS